MASPKSRRQAKPRRQKQMTTKRTIHIDVKVDVARIVIAVLSAVVAVVFHFFK